MQNQRFHLFTCLFALACSAPSGSRGDASLGSERVDALSSPLAISEYVDARTFLNSDDEVDRWYELTFALRSDFDDLCGDTFCEGDYSNYESLGFTCSVNGGTGVLAECVWLFAASTEAIDPATGRIDVQGRTWRCPLPLAPGTSVTDFLQTQTSSVERPLFTPLPGTDRTAYDGLIDCL